MGIRSGYAVPAAALVLGLGLLVAPAAAQQQGPDGRRPRGDSPASENIQTGRALHTTEATLLLFAIRPPFLQHFPTSTKHIVPG